MPPEDGARGADGRRPRVDVQQGVEAILSDNPIQILSSSGKGNGIKVESKGLEFHTQTNKRLQCPGPVSLGGGSTWTFTQCKKGWGH